MLSEPIAVIARLAEAFDSLRIPYVVGGSVASSIHGIPRATADVDLVAGIIVPNVEKLVENLSSDFYVDADMIRDAIRRRASFNVIHLPTMLKADVFVLTGDAWAQEEMKRAQTKQLDTPAGKKAIQFSSPEDTVLHKLVWYRKGNEISDRQWGDVLGVLKVRASLLDDSYLDHWAAKLGVADLLARARDQA